MPGRWGRWDLKSVPDLWSISRLPILYVVHKSVHTACGRLKWYPYGLRPQGTTCSPSTCHLPPGLEDKRLPQHVRRQTGHDHCKTRGSDDITYRGNDTIKHIDDAITSGPQHMQNIEHKVYRNGLYKRKDANISRSGGTHKCIVLFSRNERVVVCCGVHSCE